MRFLLRRLAHALFLLFGVSVLAFVLFALAPGDYLSEMRLNPQISTETLNALRHEYGLDGSLPVRYFHWLARVAHGDLGLSFAYDGPVTQLLGRRLINTLLLTVPATFLAWVIAIPIGIVAASREHKWQDRAVGLGTTTLLITPDLLLALGLLWCALRSGLLPVGGMVSLRYDEFTPLARFKDVLLHAAIPVTVWFSALFLS